MKLDGYDGVSLDVGFLNSKFEGFPSEVSDGESLGDDQVHGHEVQMPAGGPRGIHVSKYENQTNLMEPEEKGPVGVDGEKNRELSHRVQGAECEDDDQSEEDVEWEDEEDLAALVNKLIKGDEDLKARQSNAIAHREKLAKEALKSWNPPTLEQAKDLKFLDNGEYSQAQSELLVEMCMKYTQDQEMDMVVAHLPGAQDDENWKPLGGTEETISITNNQQKKSSAAVKEINVNGRDAIVEHALNLMLSSGNEQWVKQAQKAINLAPLQASKLAVPGLAMAAADAGGFKYLQSLGITGNGNKGTNLTPSLVFMDEGCGQEYEDSEATYLAVMKGNLNKGKKKHAMGGFCQGSTGINNFSGMRGYKFIMARAREAGPIAAMLLRFNKRTRHIEYFAPSGKIPKLNAACIPALRMGCGGFWSNFHPDGTLRVEPHYRSLFVRGTLVKVYSFILDNEARFGLGERKDNADAATLINYRTAYAEISIRTVVSRKTRLETELHAKAKIKTYNAQEEHERGKLNLGIGVHEMHAYGLATHMKKKFRECQKKGSGPKGEQLFMAVVKNLELLGFDGQMHPFRLSFCYAPELFMKTSASGRHQRVRVCLNGQTQGFLSKTDIGLTQYESLANHVQVFLEIEDWPEYLQHDLFQSNREELNEKQTLASLKSVVSVAVKDCPTLSHWEQLAHNKAKEGLKIKAADGEWMKQVFQRQRDLTEASHAERRLIKRSGVIVDPTLVPAGGQNPIAIQARIMGEFSASTFSALRAQSASPSAKAKPKAKSSAPGAGNSETALERIARRKREKESPSKKPLTPNNLGVIPGKDWDAMVDEAEEQNNKINDASAVKNVTSTKEKSGNNLTSSNIPAAKDPGGSDSLVATATEKKKSSRATPEIKSVTADGQPIDPGQFMLISDGGVESIIIATSDQQTLDCIAGKEVVYQIGVKGLPSTRSIKLREVYRTIQEHEYVEYMEGNSGAIKKSSVKPAIESLELVMSNEKEMLEKFGPEINSLAPFGKSHPFHVQSEATGQAKVFVNQDHIVIMKLEKCMGLAKDNKALAQDWQDQLRKSVFSDLQNHMDNESLFASHAYGDLYELTQWGKCIAMVNMNCMNFTTSLSAYLDGLKATGK